MTTSNQRPRARGIHHVTAIASDPRANFDFYSGLLGLRLVKRTVNFDDPGTYHLYYGDQEGRPGTILTFFPWPGARRGSRGTGQATVVSLSVPEGTLGSWRRRFAAHGVTSDDPVERFGEEVLPFADPDGLRLELVAHPGAAALDPWADGSVGEAEAVRGVHSVTLSVSRAEPSADLLTDDLGYRPAVEAGPRSRFRVGGEGAGAGAGAVIDLVEDPDTPQGRIAAGTVHHVAFRAIDDAEQAVWRERLREAGRQPTPVQDRRYFQSIYFREPGGVLYEIATDPPGFTRDESVAGLGAALRLPPWLEPHRERIEAVLPPLETSVGATGGEGEVAP